MNSRTKELANLFSSLEIPPECIEHFVIDEASNAMEFSVASESFQGSESLSPGESSIKHSFHAELRRSIDVLMENSSLA